MLRTTVAFVSLEFREEDWGRKISLEVVNGEVEFKAMGPEEGRQSTGRGVSPRVFQYLEIQVLLNKEQEKKTEEASSE